MNERRARPDLVSVAIAVFNGASTLPAQFHALSHQTYDGDWEVVVADNGSEDETRSVVESWRVRLPRMKLVDASERRGAPYARNRAAEEASGELILFCDQDDVVGEHWVEALTTAAPSADLMAGWIRWDEANPEKSWYMPDPLRSWSPDRRVLGFLPHGLGANLGIWRDTLDEVGGWDPSFRTTHEDTDLCWRVQLAGGVFRPVRDATVQKRFRGSLRARRSELFQQGFRSAQLYRKFRGHGMPRSGSAEAVRSWAWLLLHVAWVLPSSPRRGEWLRKAMVRFGRMCGSVRFGVLYL